MGDIKCMEIVIGGVTMSLSPATIDKVMADYERENPGRLADNMPGDEFASRMMKELKDSAFQTPKGSA